MAVALVTVLAVCLTGLTSAELLGAGTGPNSCSAPPYRARWVANFRGCPQEISCCNEYGYCKTTEAWQRGEFRDCNGISNGFALPSSTVNDEQSAANSGDISGLRYLAVPINRQFFSGILGGIGAGVGGILNGFGNAVGGIVNGVGGAVGGVANGVGGAIGGVASGAGNAVGGIASGVGNTVGGAANGVGGAVGGIASGTGGAVGGVASGAGGAIGGLASGVGNTVGGVAQGTGNFVGGVSNGIGNTVSSAANGGRQPNRPNRRPTNGFFFTRPYKTTVYTPTTFTTGTSNFVAPVDPIPNRRPATIIVDPKPQVQSVTSGQYIVDPKPQIIRANKICKKSDGYYYC